MQNGVFGIAIELTIKQDNTAQDISGYSVTYLFEKPDGTTASKAGALSDGGTGGVVTYTLADGDIDQIGQWNVQVLLTKAGVSVPTVKFPFRVKAKIS